MDTATFLDEIVNAGLDAAPADLLKTLDRRHKVMCERSRCFLAERVVPGGTVAGQQRYTAPVGLLGAHAVEVGGTPYEKGRRQDIYANSMGALLVSGPGTVFVETRDTLGVVQLALIPAPSDAGKPIVVYGSYFPLTLSMAPTSVLFIDSLAEEGLKAGVWASFLGSPAEARPDLAQVYEQQFSAACEDLRIRTRDLTRVAGPTQIRMASPYG